MAACEHQVLYGHFWMHHRQFILLATPFISVISSQHQEFPEELSRHSPEASSGEHPEDFFAELPVVTAVVTSHINLV